ncbi:MAG: ComEC/Rec2 family competence protein, partial [Acidithiobacillus ferrivorans]
QWAVSIALMPLLAGLFGQVSLISPAANVLVIPLVELLAVPLALLGALFALLDLELLSRLFFHLVALEMDAVTALLRVLLHIPFARISTGTGRTWALLAAVLGLSIFFLPMGWPGRRLALLGMVPLLIPAGGSTDLELRALDAGSGMLLFWQKGAQSGIFSANLWKAASRRSGGLALTAALRQQGVTRVDAWLRSDISAPQPQPAAARQWWPAGARDYPGGPPAAAFCRADGVAPPGMHFLTLRAPVQPCIVTWGAAPDVLILGDADAATVHRLAAEHGATLHRVQAIFAPASLGNAERTALAAAAAQAQIFYLGEGKSGTWTWQAGHLYHALPPAPAYWQPRA